MGLPARVILRIHFSFRATEQGFSSWKTNCQLATEDSDGGFGHLKALTVDGALAVRWLIEFDAANARLSTLEEEHQLAVAARERQTITGLPHSAISL